MLLTVLKFTICYQYWAQHHSYLGTTSRQCTQSGSTSLGTFVIYDVMTSNLSHHTQHTQFQIQPLIIRKKDHDVIENVEKIIIKNPVDYIQYNIFIIYYHTKKVGFQMTKLYAFTCSRQCITLFICIYSNTVNVVE